MLVNNKYLDYFIIYSNNILQYDYVLLRDLLFFMHQLNY